ncbi:hypothetical protein [Shimia marina]|uniref:Uncharacterized protein n=1 Tax=Shimia marina TaxID=321267 RepID=A0A0P1ESX1_9RHOB|nr:hypothetical protein [Shimia marina]CUH53283.1 hypothetical protein SHM7688_02736 [Shimia marina]SFD80788.1 hypothetical protein SAMN04488037_102535 [Shimia marina]
MIKLAVCAAATTLTLALPATAQSLLGTWHCLDKDTEGQAVSTIEFKKNGIMLADMRITYFVPEFDVRARAKYKSRYNFTEEGILTDTPMRARILSFTADGEDISKGEEAKMLKEFLMKDDNVQAKVTTLTATDLIIRAEGRDIVCSRDAAYLGS